MICKQCKTDTHNHLRLCESCATQKRNKYLMGSVQEVKLRLDPTHVFLSLPEPQEIPLIKRIRSKMRPNNRKPDQSFTYYPRRQIRTLLMSNHIKEKSSYDRQEKLRHCPYIWGENRKKETLYFFGHSCAVCYSKTKLTWDHWIPVSSKLFPGTIMGNMIPLCNSCNSSKNNIDALSWLISKYGFYDGQIIFDRISVYLSEYI